MKFFRFFIFGILAASGALATELILSALFSVLLGMDIETGYSDRITLFLFFAIFTEEFFKLVLLAKLLPEDTQGASAKIPLAMLFGSGFAILEIFSKTLFHNSGSPDFIYFFGIFLIHTVTSGTIGCIIVRKKYPLLYRMIQSIILSSSMHLIYNLLIIYGQSAALICAYLLSISVLLYLLKNRLAK